MFLSACDVFENKAYVMNGDDAIWYSKGNFLSLLNLPSQITQFGSLRLFWEGSRERSIQQIKPFLLNIRHTTSYFKTKLKHMYVNETLDTILQELRTNGIMQSNPYTTSEYERYSAFKVYRQSDDIDCLLSSGNVISVVYLSLNSRPNGFYICKRCDVPYRCLLFKVSFLDDVGFNKCGIWYAPVQIAVANVGKEMTQSEISILASDYAIMCPCVTNNRTL